MAQIIVGIALLILAYFTGRYFESRHYRSIKRREERFFAQPAVTGELYDSTYLIENSEFVVGSVVVSIDHFKRFIAGWKLMFGGELSTYSPLLDRGRREALLRMKEGAPHADIYVNCRLETSSISSGQGNAMGTVEVLAYATAITYGARVERVSSEVRTEEA